MELTYLEILQGILTIPIAIISFIIGSFFIKKYFKNRQRYLLLAGITWMFVVSSFWPDAISFIMIITIGIPLNLTIYYLIAIIFIPPLHITWIMMLTDFYYKEKQKIIVALITVEAIIFEIIFIIFLIIDPSLIATQLGPFNTSWTPFLMVFFIYSILLFFIPGVLFARESIKSSEKEIKLKGIFLVIAFISFTAGALIEAIVELTDITLIISRLLIISSGFTFYTGFIMPNWIKKRLTK